VAPDDYSRQATGERLNATVNFAHDDANTYDRQLNSAQLKLFISFHDGTTREIK